MSKTNRILIVITAVLLTQLLLIRTSNAAIGLITIYDYKSGVNVNKWAYEVDSDSDPPEASPNSRNLLTDADYNNVNVSDNNRWETIDPGANDYVSMENIMKINENTSYIVQLGFLFEGQPDNNADIKIYVWNLSSSSWSQIASKGFSADTDDTLTATTTSNFSNYINSTNYIKWLVLHTDTSDLFRVDYAQLNVTSDSPPNITILNYPGNNSWINSNLVDFNFTVNDDVGFTNCTLYGNFSGSWTVNKTITTIVNNSINNITIRLVDGIYIWNVLCYDNASTIHPDWYDYNYTVKVDTTKPNIVLNAPANNTNTTNNWALFNFTATDNVVSFLNCSLYINGTVNATNSSTANNTATTFNITNIRHGTYQWNVSCKDNANNINTSITRQFFVNQTPILTSVSDSPDPIKGGSIITIAPSGVGDPQGDSLNYYCSISTAPTSSNSNCSQGNTLYTNPYSSMTCTFATALTDQSNTIYCRVYDGTYYSSAVSTTFTTDSTRPITTINNVAGDTTPTYYDNVNDGWTNITIDGEAGMLCRYYTSDSDYNPVLGTNCTTVGTQAICSPTTTIEGLDAYNFYVSCADSLGNGQNSTQNLDIAALVTDWTAPTTSDNSSTAVAVPSYSALITESDNLFSSATITTKYCTDTSGSCTPDTAIDSGEAVTFTSSNRGINFLRYNSSDPAGNVQTVQNKTININQLPVFTSATDNAATIAGGSQILITTVSSDADGQTLKLFVCNSTSANSSGCTHTTYCSNTTTAANASCSFNSETDDTTHTWYAFLYDSLNEASATNKSGDYTTDSILPTITIIHPSNTTYSQTSVDAAVLTSEAASWAGYCLDACSSNTTLTSVTSTYWSKTMTVENGAHYIVFYANDSYGNMGNSSTMYFSVDTTLGDTTPPGISINSPTNNSNSSSTSIWVNITTDENLAWAGYSLNGTAVQDMNGSLKDWYIQLTNLGNAYHNVTVYANDSSANRNQANKSISFYVDTSAPQSSQVGTNFSTVNRSQSVSCFSYWIDNFNLYSGKVAENSTGSFENHTALSNGWTNYTVAGSILSLGRYTCIFYAADYAGNENSTSTSFTVQDIEAPVITIRAPDNTTYSQNSTTVEIIANEDLSWSGYCLDACSNNVTMTNVSSALWTTTVSSMSNGVHFITFYGNDSSGNMGNSSTRYFSVDTSLLDTTPPTITVWSPTNGTYYTSAYVLANITLSEAGSSAVYSLNGAANVSMGNISATNWNYTLTNLADETQHNITFYANDTSSNNNTGSKSVTFFMDRKAPLYSSAAANPTTANQSQSVSCSAYWTDGLSIASGKVAENSTGSFVNHTVSISGINGWTSYTIPASDLSVADFMCIFYATDSAGNSNTTNTTFTVQDVVAPTITINSPTNATFNQNWVIASITLSEDGKWVNYSIDGAANISMSNSSSTIWNATISSLSNAAHILTFYASDVHDNIGTSSVSFTIDTTVFDATSPSITVWSPTNGTYYTTASILANITLSEAGSSAVYSLNGTANQTMGNVSLTNWNVTLTLANGLNNITFYANDTSTNRNTGNSSTIFFYVDTSAPQNTSQGPTTGNDTVNITCYSQWTDNVALDYGILQHNETGTAVNSSQISLSETSGWVNYTLVDYNTTPSIVECKAYVFDKAGLVNTSSWLINITDTTAPAVENISYLPNTTDELDPNILINVTANVSDNVALATVVVQYKLSSESLWNESVMNLIAGNTYKGNFTPSAAGNWSFKIKANDTSNNTNTTSVHTINVSFDYTWTNVTTIPSTKSIVQTEPRNINLGNLTINNTADYDLNFTVTSNRTWITFNGTNTSLVFIVNSTRNSTTFNITANTTGFAVGSYTYTITINAYTINPTLVSSQTLSGTVVIQNVAGPYFVVSITNYDSSVTQGDTNINLSVSLENAGTGDATDTWLAWTLPSGWSNTSGLLNKSIGFLGVGSTVTNTITADVSSSASTGTQTIQASAACAEGVTGSDSKTVTVSSSTGTTTTTLGGSGGGGGGISTGALIEKILSGQEVLSSSETFELVRGYSNSFPVTVKNIFDGTTLENVSIKIEGLLSQYMTFSPSVIDKIKFNEQKQFNVTIKSPEYMEKGEHKLTIIVTGKIVSATIRKDLTDTRDVKLVIHTVSEEVVNASLQQAIKDINEMEKAGFSVAKISKLLEQAKEALAEHQYDDAKDLSEKIKEIKEESLQAYSIIQEIKIKIKNYGSITGLLNKSSITGAFLVFPNRFTETENAINLALAAFERGDFAIALQRAKDAKMTFALEKGEFNPIFFVVDYWWAILISMGILSVSGFFGYQTYQKNTITQKIISLKKEEDTIRELMAEAQRKRFTEKALGPETFNRIISHHQQRLSKIMKLRIKLRHKRTRILKPREVVKDLEEERKEIVNLLKELQKGYFVNRKISKTEYSEQTKVYNERLAEIEDEQMVLETKMYVGEKK